MTESSQQKPNPRRRRRWPWFVALGLVVALLAVALKTSRLGYESPDYEIASKEGKFELRRYAGFRTVTATMDNPAAMNRGFGQLFNYITGDNENQQNIAMTVPVLMTEDTEEASASSPDSATMSFVLPALVADRGAPVPNGKNVTLTATKAGHFAALRFDGFRNEDAIRVAEKQLRAWIKKQGWSASGELRVAYYDPPWTPGLLRRNEVLIPVDP